MINATINLSDDGKTYIFSVKGHADYDEYGKDIVCSAVSILIQTFASVVDMLYSNSMLKKKPKISLNRGDSVVTCKPNKLAVGQIKDDLHFAYIGLVLMSKAYPQCVSVQSNILKEE